tara:strand:+ start:253 stop:900 length:648 start_codon:yes stop_codon:yes gene_type:complete
MNEYRRCVLCFLIFFFSTTLVFSQSEDTSNKLSSGTSSKETLSIKEVIDNILKQYFLSSEKQKKNNKLGVKMETSIIRDSLGKSPLESDGKIDMSFSREGHGAKIRIFDKLYGFSQDINVLNGAHYRDNSIKLVVSRCVYDEEKPFNESLAFIKVSQKGMRDIEGWLSSSVININNIDNYRYNFWLLSCVILNQQESLDNPKNEDSVFKPADNSF